MQLLKNNDVLPDIPEYPLYFIRFEKLYEPLESYQLNATTKEIIRKLSWDFVLYTYLVITKSFQEANTHLQNVINALNALVFELREQDPLAVIKMQEFAYNLQKQYNEFLFKKKISTN